MLNFQEIPEYLEELDRASRILGAQLFTNLPGCGREIICAANTDITIQAAPSLIYIISGCLKWFDHRRLVRLYSDGDWLFANPDGMGANCQVVSDFGCQAQIFPRAEFLAALRVNSVLLEQWQSYQEQQNRILLGLVGLLASEDMTANFLIQSFRPGKIIVTEGTTSHEVYVMIEGRALVQINSHTIGQITANEVFGEISFLTEQPRSATVIAQSACLVQIIEREQFAFLIKSKPELLRRTATTLAQRLIELNRQLMTLGKNLALPTY